MRGLYVHIPFCIKKCAYCDFNSFAACGMEKKSYLSALFGELEKYRDEAVDTAFIGGGTPTSLESGELYALLCKINECFSIDKNAEYTVEANPKTLDAEKLTVMKNGGVNRISIGVQSFCDDELKRIGRIHTAEEAKETVRLAQDCGFDNINIDLMLDLPGQTMKSFKKTLAEAVDLGTRHISCYSLILEDGTPLFDEFENGDLDLPDEELERDMYEYACGFLAKNGFCQYEISNFANPGYESRHNLKYWQCKEYIGVGLSAHSYDDGKRFSNTDDFSEYISRHYSSGTFDKLTEKDMMSEFMFLGLRMTKGVSERDFYARFGKEMKSVFKKPLEKFVKNGFLKEENGYIRLSHSAVSVSNSIMCEFIL